MLSPPKIRYFVLYKNDLNSHKSFLNRKKDLRRVFPKAGIKGFEKRAVRSRAIRG